MINSKDIIFTEYTDVSGILGRILSIKVYLTYQNPGNATIGDWESVIITSMTIDESYDVSAMTLYIDSPLTHINGTYEFTRSDSDCLHNDDIGSKIDLIFDNSWDSLHPGVYPVSGQLRLRCVDISIQRFIGIDTNNGGPIDYAQGLSLSDGYNISVSYDDRTGSLDIVGGPGMGLGRYHGKSDDNTKNYYSGVRSINGLRNGHNVNIELSDALVEHGARIGVE